MIQRPAGTGEVVAAWRPAPRYLTAVGAVHTAAGVLATFAGAGVLASVALEFIRGTVGSAAFPAALAYLALATGSVGIGLGVLFLLSGESIRRRRRRGLSFCCGVLLFFTGPLFVLGLASVIALTRRRVLDYYGPDAPAPAFPVLPARRST